MKASVLVLVTFVVLLLTGAAQAEVAVIVHPSVGFDALSEVEVAHLFLGKSDRFPSGGQAVPVNQNEGAAVREAFYLQVCKKNASQYKAYWSQRVFTAKGVPPKDAGDDAAVKALVAANPGMIGYIDASSVDASVKVVFKLP